MDLSYILFALLVGLVAGFAARALVPGKDPMGLLPTVGLGLAGSLIGAITFRAIGIGDKENFDLGGVIGAVVGAMVLLVLFNMVTGRKNEDRVAV